MKTHQPPAVSLQELQGFVVESGSMRVGIVEGFRNGTGSGIPDCLVVRAGRFARPRVMISTDDVRQILPRQKRIILQPAWMTIKI